MPSMMPIDWFRANDVPLSIGTISRASAALCAMASRAPPLSRRSATVPASCPPSIRPARHKSPSASVSSRLKRMNVPNCSYGLLLLAIGHGPPKVSGNGTCRIARGSYSVLLLIPIDLIDLHVLVVLLDVRRERVRAVVLGHEIEEVALRRRGGGAQRGQAGVSDRAGG